MKAGQGVKSIVDPPTVIGCGDPILGDHDGDVSGGPPGVAHGLAQGGRVILPAGQGLLHILRDRSGAIVADEGAQVGLHPYEVVTSCGLGEKVLTRVAVLLHVLLTARQGLEILTGNGPTGLDSRSAGKDCPSLPVGLDQGFGDDRVGGGQGGGSHVAALLPPLGQSHHIGLVDRADPGDTFQNGDEVLHVPAEEVCGGRITPAPPPGQPAGQGHVVQGDHGGHPGLEAGFDHGPVVQELGLGEEPLLRLHPGPLH